MKINQTLLHKIAHNMGVKRVSSVCLLLLLSIAFLSGCSEEEGTADGPPRGAAQIPSVEIVQAQRGALPLEERLVGIVKAGQSGRNLS